MERNIWFAFNNHFSTVQVEKYPDIPWSEIIRMRDIVAHHYTGIKNEIIFDTVKKDIPDLISALERMLRDLENI